MGINIQIGDEVFTPSEVRKMVKSGVVVTKGNRLVFKHDLAGSPAAQVSHGTYWDGTGRQGFLTTPGAEPDMFSAVTMPSDIAFWQRALSAGGPTLFTDPVHSILTGIGPVRGSNASDDCAPGPRVGLVKLCERIIKMGKTKIETDQYKLTHVGERLHRADVDRNLVNSPVLRNPFIPAAVTASPGNINTPVGQLLLTLGFAQTRAFNRVLYHGDYANTGGAAVPGFVQEFHGLDKLIVTGHKDVTTEELCPAADSIIIDWGGATIADEVEGVGVVELFAHIDAELHNRADAMWGDSSTFVYAIHMDQNLFWSLTALWPCSYLTSNCGVVNNDGQRVNVDGAMQVEMRDKMRQGSFLWINGRQIPVIQTRGAIETPALGPGLSSSVYFVPESVAGRRVTYVDYFDMANGDITELLGVIGDRESVASSNGGLYMSFTRRTDVCLEFGFISRPRLVLETPYLAARVENMVFTAPMQRYFRSAYPGDAYYVEGGKYFNPGS